MSRRPARPNLDDIEERASQATRGPWRKTHNAIVGPVGSRALIALVAEGKFTALYEGNPAKEGADSRFIAAARRDVPDLVRWARHLERRLQRAGIKP